MPSALPRPRQVTIAGWMIMAGSAAVVLTVFQQIAGLQSMDTREAVQRVLAERPFDGLGLSVDELLSLIRVLSMVAARCATATAILGWQALQRSKSARVALSVLAVPLLITGIGTGGILSTAVAVAVLLLWLQPARDWFDGRWRPAPTEQPTQRAERPAPPRRQAPPGSQQPGSQQPPPYVGWPPPQGSWPPPSGPAPGGPVAGGPVAGGPVASSPVAGGQPPASWPPPVQPSLHAPVAPVVERRPPAVLAAVVLTWVCSLLLGGLFVVGAAYLISSPDTLMDEMTRQYPELVSDGTITVGLLRGTLAVMVALVAVWVLAACVVAFFVLRGAPWARILLLLSTAVAGLALAVCSLVNAGMLVPLAGAGATFALLIRRDVTAWFKR